MGEGNDVMKYLQRDDEDVSWRFLESPRERGWSLAEFHGSICRRGTYSRFLYTGKLCTCLGSFVSRREKKKKKLDSSNGTRGDGTSRWISFYLERRFATFCQRKLKDRMLTEEQLRFCEKKKQERNQIHVTKISRMDRSNHFVNRFIKQNEISFICTIMSNYQRYTFNICIYIFLEWNISL